MENLNKSIDYTKQKKEHQITKLESSFYLDSFKQLEAFLNSDGRMIQRVGSSFGYLSIWYIWQFNHEFVSEKQVNTGLLAQSTVFAMESNNADDFLGKKVATYDCAIQFTDAIKHCAQALLLGWDDKAQTYLQLLIKMLYGKQYKGRIPYSLHPWYMLELLCKWQGIPLDYEQLKRPESLGVYDIALQNWDTQDEVLLNQIIDKMSEYHIKESDEYEHDDRRDADFTSANYFIFAIEIVLWLAIRKRLGLKDYVPNNELMKLAINQLPVEAVSIPTIDIIEQCKAKIRADNPTIDFEI